MATTQPNSSQLAPDTLQTPCEQISFIVLELEAHGLALQADALYGGWNHRYLNVTGRWSARGSETVQLISWPDMASAAVAAEVASKARGRPVKVSSMGTISSNGEVDARGFSAYGDELHGALLGYLPYTGAAAANLEARRLKMMRYASAVWMLLSECAMKGTEAGVAASRSAAKGLHKQYGGGSVVSAIQYLAGKDADDLLGRVLDGELQCSEGMTPEKLLACVKASRGSEYGQGQAM